MNKRPVIASKMTTVKKDVKIDTTQPQGTPRCPIHKTTKHLLDNCRVFKSRPFGKLFLGVINFVSNFVLLLII